MAILKSTSELTLIKTMTTVQQKYRSLVLKRNSVNLSNFCGAQFCLPISKAKAFNADKIVLPQLQKNCGAQKKSLLQKEQFEACGMLIEDKNCKQPKIKQNY